MNTNKERTELSTADFEEGTEFRADYAVFTRNKRGHTNMTERKSEVFATFEEARAYVEAVDSVNGTVKVRRPNTKNFIPYYNAKAVK